MKFWRQSSSEVWHCQNAKKSQDQADYEVFKKHRSTFYSRIREAKKNYFSQQINENKDDPKKLWKALKVIGCVYKNGSKSRLELDQANISNHFNVFYASVAKDLVPNSFRRI